MAKFISPLTDFGFKKLFGEEDSKIYLVDFLNSETHQVLIDKLCFVFIELPKFKKSLQEAKTHQDKWLYLISHLENLQEVPLELQENIYTEFLHKAEICEFSPLKN